MPTPQEAAKILRDAMASGFDPVKARLLQEQQAKALQRNRDLADETNSRAVDARVMNRFKSPSERQRDRMMGWDLGAPTAVSGATDTDIEKAQNDLADSPNFGRVAAARTAKRQSDLDALNLSQSTQFADDAKTRATTNAFAAFMNAQGVGRGKYAADVSTEGDTALDAASRRKQAENTALGQGRLGRSGMPVTRLNPGDDPLKGLSAQQIAAVNKLASYDLPVTGTQLRTPEWQDLVERAIILDPTFSPAQYEIRQKMKGDRRFQENIQALGTAQSHLAGWESKFKDVGNTDYPPVNAFKNWLGKNVLGSEAIKGLEIDQQTLSTEVPKALKGDTPTIPEIAEWKDKFGTNQGTSQARNTVSTTGDILAKRLEQARQRYDSIMGKPGAFDEYMKTQNDRADLTAAGGGAASFPPAGTRKQFKNGRWGVSDGIGWVPE